ncbi:MFS transporter [Streptomyces albus subsp. chlorinus]|uniref:MFS transporter n=1 Tax=Streptomyces albus TaxID=1888 RepID=UPI0015714EB9|nr:MFS transporter [Streptomyces albus subsp. chlorinus]
MQLVLALDASIVHMALPAIGRDLHFAQADSSWGSNACTLAFGEFMMFGGRVAELAGRRMFDPGSALLTVASLAGGLAPTPAALVTARAARGLGATLVALAALSLITTLFAPGPERNRAFGLLGAVVGAGGAAGALLGGLLTDWFGRRPCCSSTSRSASSPSGGLRARLPARATTAGSPAPAVRRAAGRRRRPDAPRRPRPQYHQGGPGQHRPGSRHDHRSCVSLSVPLRSDPAHTDQRKSMCVSSNEHGLGVDQGNRWRFLWCARPGLRPLCCAKRMAGGTSPWVQSRYG